jgi:hypothetical protein
LGTNLILGTSGTKKPAFYKDLVGAVGIENTSRWNLKELEGVLGNAKALKKSRGADGKPKFDESLNQVDTKIPTQRGPTVRERTQDNLSMVMGVLSHCLREGLENTNRVKPFGNGIQ